MDYDVKFAHEQNHINMIQTLFKNAFPTDRKLQCSLQVAVCSFSFAFQSAPWGTWKEHDCTEWRRFPYVCHTCVPVNHTPSRTNLTHLKCRLRRHGSMVNMISDSSLSYWGNIEKAEQYTRLQNTVFKMMTPQEPNNWFQTSNLAQWADDSDPEELGWASNLWHLI